MTSPLDYATEYKGFQIAPRMGRYDVYADGKIANGGTAQGFDSHAAARAWVDADELAELAVLDACEARHEAEDLAAPKAPKRRPAIVPTYAALDFSPVRPLDTASPTSIPKSLHTVTAFVRVARLILTLAPDAYTPTEALAAAIAGLGYPTGTADPHALAAIALRQLKASL